MTAQPELDAEVIALADVQQPAKISSSWVPYTPAMAKRILDEQNTHNRPLNRRIVNMYASDMAHGRWQMAGDPVRFAADGTLLDGQHRLAAVVASGKTITMLTLRGIRSDAQAVMDTGRSRSAADAVAMSLSGKRSTIRASAAKLAILVERGVPLDVVGGQQIVTHSDILAWIEANPDEEDAAEIASRYARRSDVPGAVVAYTALVLGRIDRIAAAQFWADAATKVGLEANDPMVAFTSRIAEVRRSRKQVTRAEYLSAIYRVWNARRTGQTIRQLRLRSHGGGVEIPEPK